MGRGIEDRTDPSFLPKSLPQGTYDAQLNTLPRPDQTRPCRPEQTRPDPFELAACALKLLDPVPGVSSPPGHVLRQSIGYRPKTLRRTMMAPTDSVVRTRAQHVRKPAGADLWDQL